MCSLNFPLMLILTSHHNYLTEHLTFPHSHALRASFYYLSQLCNKRSVNYSRELRVTRYLYLQATIQSVTCDASFNSLVRINKLYLVKIEEKKYYLQSCANLQRVNALLSILILGL